MIRIVFLGASVNWVPRLLTDLLVVFPEALDVWFVDIDPEAARLCKAWGQEANRVYRRNDRYEGTTDRRSALLKADAVLITLTTGGFPAMAADISIPESYGIFSTVGDTCGPSGWSRSIRNIFVFEEFAQDFSELCPGAIIVNYTNPMGTLSSVLQRSCGNPVVGLCHAYFETRDVLAHILKLSDDTRLRVGIAGLNHFTWVTDFDVDGKPVDPTLAVCLGDRPLSEFMPEETEDEIGFSSGHRLCVELFNLYHRLPYPADRHTVEFVPWGITNDPERRPVLHKARFPYEELARYGVRRTAISHRVEYQKLSRKHFDEIFTSEPGTKPVRSRETGSDMIRAFLFNGTITDAVNALNEGQIEDLPRGVCVETLGTVNAHGVHPLKANPLPDPVNELLRPHALSQLWLVEGMLERRPESVLQALMIDPQCRDMAPDDVLGLYDALVEASQPYADLAFLLRKATTR